MKKESVINNKTRLIPGVFQSAMNAHAVPIVAFSTCAYYAKSKHKRG